MPIIKSAKKRVRTANKAAIRNSKTKRYLKDALKLFTKSPAAKSHSKAQSAVDKAANKGIIHKNKAARLKSKAAKKAKAAGLTLTKATKTTAPSKKIVKTTKTVTKKPAAKKPVTKKK